MQEHNVAIVLAAQVTGTDVLNTDIQAQVDAQILEFPYVLLCATQNTAHKCCGKSRINAIIDYTLPLLPFST